MNNFWTFVKTLFLWLLIGIGFMAFMIVVILAVSHTGAFSTELSQAILLSIASSALSVFLSYFPVVRVKFAALSETVKSLVNLLSIVAVAVLLYVGVCIGWLTVAGLACTQGGIQFLVVMTAVAIFANQTADRLSVDAPDVKLLKATTDKTVG